MRLEWEVAKKLERFIVRERKERHGLHESPFCFVPPAKNAADEISPRKRKTEKNRVNRGDEEAASESRKKRSLLLVLLLVSKTSIDCTGERKKERKKDREIRGKGWWRARSSRKRKARRTDFKLGRRKLRGEKELPREKTEENGANFLTPYLLLSRVRPRSRLLGSLGEDLSFLPVLSLLLLPGRSRQQQQELRWRSSLLTRESFMMESARPPSSFSVRTEKLCRRKEGRNQVP